MKQIFILLSLILVAGCAHQAPEPNALSRSEQRAGWKLLFDGTSSAGWTANGKETFPTQGWKIENGELIKVAGARGGDIITVGRYSEFDFRWEWKIAPKGNNGIKYFITPERKGVGHEYQMLDDLTQPEGKDNGKHSTASFYEVIPPWDNKPSAIKPAGEWNSSRVFVQGDKVEHYLNGQKVLEYQLGSQQVKEGVAKSKFKNVPKFGERVKGHILLTDHSDGASFRNVKILDLSKD